MKKNALIVLADGFEEIEAVTPIDILRRSGIQVQVAGLRGMEVSGSRDVLIVADCLLEDADGMFDALVFPGGGQGAKNLAASETVLELIRSHHRAGKIVAAICASPALVLAPSGALDGKKATGYPGVAPHGGKNLSWCEEPVVIDGNVVTSMGPGTAFEFSIALSRLLAGESAAEKVKNATCFRCGE
jgi:4-methyl-5(b-hydroxyethyl)-thiazole monophosphate biosynthesis